MRTLSTSFKWINENLLFLLSAFLLAFIPLFPKIPLFDALPGYIVKVRLEDFLVIVTCVVWLREVIRKRVMWNSSYFWLVFSYGVAGALSIVLGILLLNSIPAQLIHIGKSGLHLFRYLEYFALFFFLFSAVRNTRQVIIALVILAATVTGVVGYGVGQKYLHWPVFSTMNREYSKGQVLYLQEGARPQSTFGGHYDMAAYLVIVLPLLFSASLGGIKMRKQWQQRAVFVILQLIHLTGFGMLVLSGSKMSFLGYLLGMGIVVALHWWRLPTWKLRLMWGGNLCALGVIGIVGAWVVAPTHLKTKVLSMLHADQNTDRPVDLVGDGFQDKVMTTTLPDGTVKTETIRVKSDWSPNALKYGLSMGIRLDTLWPQALLGLARNPLTGAGYGTLAMLDSHQFNEADSTDNNYLRTVGETGILGFVLFYGIIGLILWEVFTATQTKDPLVASIAIGFTGSVIGLLIAASYIDVFAASKVAFTFWAVAGLVLKGIKLHQTQALSPARLFQPLRRIGAHLYEHWPLYTIVLLSFFLLHQDPFMERNILKDLNNHTARLEQLVSVRCFINHQTLSVCRNSGAILKSQWSIYALLLIPFMRLLPNLGLFYYLNIGLIALSTIITYFLIRSKTSQFVIFVSLLANAVLASLLKFTHAPLTEMYFLWILGGFPLTAFLISRVLSQTKNQLVIRGIFIGLCGVFIYALVSSNLSLRFQNSADNFAFHTVRMANATVVSTPEMPAYFITSLNPYFVDLYSTNTYTVLPLSSTQPYANMPQKVWGIESTDNLLSLYSSLIAKPGKVFVGDYNTIDNQAYHQNFQTIKDEFDLTYASLGCNETCNIYQLHPEAQKVSMNPSSPFNNTSLSMKTLQRPYHFTIVSNRFDGKFIPPGITFDTKVLSQRLANKSQSENFMVLTGDAIENKDPKNVDVFRSTFTNRVNFPVLYSSGNEDVKPDKYFTTGLQTFYTDQEYYILLNTDPNSHLTMADQLKLYDVFLELEKLPSIKNIFIISHNLNWQDTSDRSNIIHAIERQLAKFPALHAYILTSNHRVDLVSPAVATWSETKDSSQITYMAGLVAGDPRDTYFIVTINPDGTVTTSSELLK